MNKRKERMAGVGLMLILAGLIWLLIPHKKYAIVDTVAYRSRQIGF